MVSWAGVVLTGGAGSRMGTDKALLAVGGSPMALRVARTFREAGASRVLCVGGDLDTLGSFGLETLADRWPGEGPLGGIVTVFDALTTRSVRRSSDAVSDRGAARRWRLPRRRPPDVDVMVVAPCDLLAPDPALFVAVLGALCAGDAHVAVPVVNGVRQPLNGAYRLSAHLRLQQAFDRGERSVKRALLELDVVEVDNLAPAALADADWPSDL